MKQTKNKAAKATALFFVLGLVVFELPLYQGGSSCGSNKKMMQRCWVRLFLLAYHLPSDDGRWFF
ncbi:hypothetical protein [Moraxella catarrhalis]|uniref:hypothetical protein n=1 Tax=Moraxella catarrhalis TaxID=480 RepID=UPI00128BC9F3|nr:hypothetical protein [Moraxella catarrhalis]MPX16907.1 hypothetical protein [Moraxella catarrhalis]MPY08996.1 hypothetical protein [Moraxella catarrhalis]